MHIPTLRLAIAACSLGTALPASAADIRAQLTPELIYSHCQAAGVGSETEGTFMLPGGRVTGTVLCTEADLVAPPMTASRRHDDDEGYDDDNGHNEDDDHDEGSQDD
jgi:hypothetical protein